MDPRAYQNESTAVTTVAVAAPLSALVAAVFLGGLHFWLGAWVNLVIFYFSVVAVIIGFIAGFIGWRRFRKAGRQYLLARCYVGIVSPFVFLLLCILQGLLFMGVVAKMTS